MRQLQWAEIAAGQELAPLVKPPVTREQLVRYASASDDHNPIHTDDETARAVGLPSVIAHGMLSMGFLGQYAGALVGEHGYVERLKVRFRAMVFPGDVLTCRGTVVAKDEQTCSVRLAIAAEREPGVPLTSGEAVLVFTH